MFYCFKALKQQQIQNDYYQLQQQRIFSKYIKLNEIKFLIKMFNIKNNYYLLHNIKQDVNKGYFKLCDDYLNQYTKKIWYKEYFGDIGRDITIIKEKLQIDVNELESIYNDEILELIHFANKYNPNNKNVTSIFSSTKQFELNWNTWKIRLIEQL